jgi:hypothetical protein
LIICMVVGCIKHFWHQEITDLRKIYSDISRHIQRQNTTEPA